MNSLSFNNDVFPPETLLHMFSYLPLKALVAAGKVCKAWHIVVEDAHLWVPFANKIDVTGTNPYVKTIFIARIEATREMFVKTNSVSFRHQVHITFSRVGLSSLDRAYECLEKSNKDSFPDMCISLVSEYLRNDSPDQTERILEKMDEGWQRFDAAFNVLQYYVTKGQLEKIDLPLKYFTCFAQKANPALCLIIDAAKKTKNIEVALFALKSLKDCRLWEACAKDFIRFLNEDSAVNEVTQIYLRHIYLMDLKAGESFLTAEDVEFYLYTGQLDMAESSAMLLTGLEKEESLRQILSFYNETQNQEGIDRINDLKKPTLKDD